MPYTHTPMSKNGRSELVLRDDEIIKTVSKLQLRIHERFPDSGLSKLCVRLREVAEQTSERSVGISNPIRWVRFVGYTVSILLVTLFLAAVVYGLQTSGADRVGFFDLIQAIDAALNELILLTLAVFFLINLETRLKRQRALKAIHELRSIAHVIDMHQLTKDPERLLGEWSATENSPKPTMSAMQLNRYLDYCTEMLSLVGKIAVLYVQHFDDAAAVAAVSEVEQLTTGLTRKIWQKIMILSETRDNKRSVAGLVTPFHQPPKTMATTTTPKHQSRRARS